MTTVVSDALAAFVRAHDDYHGNGNASDEDAALQRAEAAMSAAFKAKEA